MRAELGKSRLSGLWSHILASFALHGILQKTMDLLHRVLLCFTVGLLTCIKLSMYNCRREALGPSSTLTEVNRKTPGPELCFGTIEKGMIGKRWKSTTLCSANLGLSGA